LLAELFDAAVWAGNVEFAIGFDGDLFAVVVTD
jgi:hypothetical protein